MVTAGSGLVGDLAAIVGRERVLPGTTERFLHDATETRGLRGRPDAVCLPSSADDVRRLVAWCYAHDVPVVPRGGGTGYAGGAVAVAGGVVLALEGLARVRRFDPLLWRIELEAGVSTARLRRLAHEHGLLFPPDPGAAEQSQVGGNIATNAGGPHAFKYGTTGAWVTGLEAVVAPGELVVLGGPLRKDVAGYDLVSLLVGSEGTLGVVTAAWLRLVPRPAERAAVVAFYDGARTGCAALEALLGSGVGAAAIEFLDAGTLAAVGGGFPGDVPAGAAFALLVEADGSAEEAPRVHRESCEILSESALGVVAAERPPDVAALWRWRERVSYALVARRGGKVSEDIAVPVDKLADAVDGTVEIGSRHGLAACSFGHAGDGNLHSTFLVDLDDASELDRAQAAAGELFDLCLSLGGTISGEHGTGCLKSRHLEAQLSPRALALHRAMKDAWDPKHLFNPGKKGTATATE